MPTDRRNVATVVATPFAKLAAVGGALAVSAFLMALAVQSPKVWWLGWVTLLPLLLAIRVLPPLRAVAAGSFWGVCFFLFSLWSGEVPFAPTFASFALLSTIPGVYAGLGSVITRRAGFSPLLLGLGWVGVELALQPLAMHNGLLAGTQGDGLVIRLVGNVAGYALVAFLVAYVNAALLSVFTHVCVTASASRFVGGSSNRTPRFVPSEVRVDFFHFLRPSQPRGPPA